MPPKFDWAQFVNQAAPADAPPFDPRAAWQAMESGDGSKQLNEVLERATAAETFHCLAGMNRALAEFCIQQGWMSAAQSFVLASDVARRLSFVAYANGK